MKKAIFNGKLIDLSDANINIAEKGYFFDFAVYSSVKVIRGKAFFPEYHIDRLFESAKIIGLEHGFKKNDVMRWTSRLISEDKLTDALLRYVLIGDTDGNKKAKLFIFAVSGLTFYPRKLYGAGVKAITWQGERRLPKAKTKDLLLGYLALREAEKRGALEALLVDHDGNIREGTRSNFFAIKGNSVITPPPEKTLEGITKKMICQAIKGHFKLKCGDIPLKKIKSYEEFFISSTSMNVMPVRQIDNFRVKSDFKKTRLIQKLYKKYYDEKTKGGRQT